MVAPKRRFFVPVLPAVGLAAVAAGPVLQALGSSGPANSVSASLATTHGSGDDGPGGDGGEADGGQNGDEEPALGRDHQPLLGSVRRACRPSGLAGPESCAKTHPA